MNMNDIVAYLATKERVESIDSDSWKCKPISVGYGFLSSIGKEFNVTRPTVRKALAGEVKTIRDMQIRMRCLEIGGKI